jgi:hypothetical protein
MQEMVVVGKCDWPRGFGGVSFSTARRDEGRDRWAGGEVTAIWAGRATLRIISGRQVRIQRREREDRVGIG